MKKILGLVFTLLFLCSQAFAQGAGGSDFQFNELDFDRQGSGTGVSPYGEGDSGQSGSYPATRFLDPSSGEKGSSGGEEDLTTLFSDLPSAPGTANDAAPEPPKTEGNLHNLPGEPSPVSEPAQPGEAKIELSPEPTPVQPPKPPVVASTPAKPRATREKPQNGTVNNRWYWASQTWREHSSQISGCPSYVENRPLYNVRCIAAVAKYSRSSSSANQAASYAPSAGDYIAPGLKDIRQFP